MQIIIPMSGLGQRFINAGYIEPKPLIKVDGIPIIEHVINLFPGEQNFTFICNKQHLATTKMRSIILNKCPNGKIIEIPKHKKGPVYAVSFIYDLIDDQDEIIINYCDFSKYWNYQDFLKDTRTKNADGAIPAYKGFHPHMLKPNNYAFMREKDNWMIEIREKQPFTDNRMAEYASDGTYYFKKGAYVKKYFNRLMEKKITVKDEYYVSMVYNLLVEDGLKVSIYEIEHMLQWGTPRDLEEYTQWSDYFREILKPIKKIKSESNSINLIPLAGAGNRFAQEGFTDPKPLIKVNNKPMIIQAAGALPPSQKNIFVCLDKHLDNYPLENEIRKEYPGAKIVKLNRITEGQACTCEIGLMGEDLEAPLLIGACDNGMLWNHKKYEQLINQPDIDAIVWSFRRHPSIELNPKMYGWIKTDDIEYATKVSVKVPISSDPYNDHAIVGTFYFKKVKYFTEALALLYKSNERINNEFYVDSVINKLLELNLKVKVFEIDNYICWGTPDDLRTYEYWQNFFDKCEWHPYKKNIRNKNNSVKNKSYVI